MNFRPTISAYHDALAGDPDHRFRSWEHCYGFFQRTKPAGLLAVRDTAALQLGFYLASWGMYRGSSFLLQHAYTAHLAVVDFLTSPSLASLWKNDIGSKSEHCSLTPIILAAVEGVKGAYRKFGEPTDTLATKVLLGTMGCVPACDEFFIEGFKREGFPYSYFNQPFVDRLLQFCFEHMADLREEQIRIEAASGITYPFMKLVDMHFWQLARTGR
jgi:hypothetical protein